MIDDNDSIEVSKDEYILNVLGLGIAVELLARISKFGTSITWAEEIGREANKRFSELNEEDVNKIFNYYKLTDKAMNAGDKN